MAAAQVQVPNERLEGRAFTLTVPVRVPAGTEVRYEWFRNDTLILGTLDTLTVPATGKSYVAYVVPSNRAHGEQVAFHFMYWLSGTDCWTPSQKYLITFMPPPCNIVGGAIASDDLPRCGIAVGEVVGYDIPLSAPPVAHPTCGIVVGVVSGDNPLGCGITAGMVSGNDAAIPAPPAPHDI